MRDSIRSFFERQMAQPPNGGNGGTHHAGSSAGKPDPAALERRRLHVAACALLLELAHADDHFSDAERMHVEAVMRRHFELDEETVLDLMRLAEAERAEAIDLYQFTRLIREGYDLGQKTLLAEIMWGLIMTDGEVAQHEAYMLRKIANLLDLKPGYLSDARKRASEGP